MSGWSYLRGLIHSLPESICSGTDPGIVHEQMQDKWDILFGACPILLNAEDPYSQGDTNAKCLLSAVSEPAFYSAVLNEYPPFCTNECCTDLSDCRSVPVMHRGKVSVCDSFSLCRCVTEDSFSKFVG